VTGDVQRAVGYLLVGSLALLAPLLAGRVDATLAAVGTVAPFVLLATIALASTDGPVFEFFARRGDREEERLYSLASFALAVCALAVLFVALDLPLVAFVAAVFVLTAGNLGQLLAFSRTGAPIVGAAAFVAFGTVAAVGAVYTAGELGGPVPPFPTVLFVTASGAIVGAIVRATLSPSDDSSALLSTALVVWFLSGLDPVAGIVPVAIGLGATVALGYAAYALGTASTTGALSGVLLSLWAVVLGGYGWFALLVTFFGLGALASKYRYEEKLDRGIAQENEGARGGSNVLANSAVALVAIVAAAAAAPTTRSDPDGLSVRLRRRGRGRARRHVLERVRRALRLAAADNDPRTGPAGDGRRRHLAGGACGGCRRRGRRRARPRAPDVRPPDGARRPRGGRVRNARRQPARGDARRGSRRQPVRQPARDGGGGRRGRRRRDRRFP